MDDGQIIAFPSRANRSWRVLEAGLCPALYQIGADAAQVTHLCNVLQPIWEHDSGITVKAGTDPEDSVQQVNRWFAQVATALLMEIATRELKLFNAGLI